jgi:hypothetical protein
VNDKYQFNAEEMKLVRDALTVYYDSCGDHYRNAPTPELREKILEVTGELEILIDKLSVPTRQH